MTWSLVSDTARTVALAQARGVYQANLIHGVEALSGSTLKGKASRYGAVYKQSRTNFLARLRAAGLVVTEARGQRGRRVLVVAKTEAEAQALAGAVE